MESKSKSSGAGGQPRKGREIRDPSRFAEPAGQADVERDRSSRSGDGRIARSAIGNSRIVNSKGTRRCRLSLGLGKDEELGGEAGGTGEFEVKGGGGFGEEESLDEGV